jgi:hypothetical protein
MGVMALVRKWQERKKEKSEKFKQMQEEDKLNEMLLERKKSSNRRELERYYKEQEEKQIKEALDKIHKQQNKESWKGNNFNNKMTILKDDRPILKEKNIFMDNKNKVPIQTQREGMFFRW